MMKVVFQSDSEHDKSGFNNFEITPKHALRQGSDELIACPFVACTLQGSIYKPSKLPPAPLEIWAYEVI